MFKEYFKEGTPQQLIDDVYPLSLEIDAFMSPFDLREEKPVVYLGGIEWARFAIGAFAIDRIIKAHKSPAQHYKFGREPLYIFQIWDRIPMMDYLCEKFKRFGLEFQRNRSDIEMEHARIVFYPRNRDIYNSGASGIFSENSRRNVALYTQRNPYCLVVSHQRIADDFSLGIHRYPWSYENTEGQTHVRIFVGDAVRPARILQPMEYMEPGYTVSIPDKYILETARETLKAYGIIR